MGLLSGKLNLYRNVCMLRNALTADPRARQKFAAAQTKYANLSATLNTIRSLCSQTTLHCDDEPLFVFSACWRSGSTMLQRMLMHSNHAMIWGEPYALCSLLPNLQDQLRPISEAWPKAENAIDALRHDPTDSWIANLHPGLDALINSHRSFIQNLYRNPATALGHTRWGFKEVRYGDDEVRYLRLLFPRAKFVFLVRNPINAYRSFKHHISPDFVRWPNEPVCTPRQFAEMWVRLVTDFIQSAEDEDALLVRYEDLVSNSDTAKALSKHVGYEVPCAAKLRVIQGSATNVNLEYIPRLDRMLIASHARPVAADLGYDL